MGERRGSREDAFGRREAKGGFDAPTDNNWRCWDRRFSHGGGYLMGLVQKPKRQAQPRRNQEGL
jgi:hypothetical protein